MSKKNIYGYIPSKIDGSEHVFEIDSKIEIPDSYSWKEVLPPVRNQGSEQTCVCQSLTCMLDFITNCQNDTPNICNNFSIKELYNQRSNKPQEGMSIKEGMDILKKKGLNGVKIKSYAMVPSVMAMKQCIMSFGPCIGGLPVYNDNDPYFWRKGNDYAGGHAITFVGWHPTKGFLIRNSWGKNWNGNGHVYIPYKEFEDSIFEVWTCTI